MPQAAHARLRADRFSRRSFEHGPFLSVRDLEALRPRGLSFNAEVPERDLRRAPQFGSC